MRKKSIIFIAALLVLSLAVVGCGGGSKQNTNQGTESPGTGRSESANKGSAESVTWIANSVWPDDNHVSQALHEFATQVEEVTDGKVKLDVKTGGSLGYNGPELLKAVRDGIVPVSDLILSGVAGDEPLFGLNTLPFLIRNFDEAKTLSEIYRPYFDKVAEEKWNQKILYVAPWPIAGFWTKNEVKSLADMKGLKMRTYDENGALVVEAAGGTPYPLPFSEVYSSLATGVIDSVLTSTPTAVDAKFWEVLGYYVPASVTMANNILTVNLDEFNKLDQATQDAIVQAGKEIEAQLWEKVEQIDKDMETVANENGITTLPPSEEFMDELSTITEEIRTNWLKQAPAEAQEIIDKFHEAVGR